VVKGRTACCGRAITFVFTVFAAFGFAADFVRVASFMGGGERVSWVK
jgi:hypothetical protein